MTRGSESECAAHYTTAPHLLGSLKMLSNLCINCLTGIFRIKGWNKHSRSVGCLSTLLATCISFWLFPCDRVQLYRLSTVDTHNVTLKPVRGKLTRHHSRLCSVAFRCVHMCEISYTYPEHDIKLHPNRVKFYRKGCIGSRWPAD